MHLKIGREKREIVIDTRIGLFIFFDVLIWCVLKFLASQQSTNQNRTCVWLNIILMLCKIIYLIMAGLFLIYFFELIRHEIVGEMQSSKGWPDNLKFASLFAQRTMLFYFNIR